MMPARSCLLVAACVMLSVAACPVAGRSGAAPLPSESQLQYDGRNLRLVAQGVEVSCIAVPDAVPYQVIHRGDPAIVTTCGPELVPATWVAGAEITVYENTLPQLVEPPVIALAALESVEDAPGSRSLLLGADGTVLWEHPNAQLLTPACGPAGGTAVLAVPCSGDFMAPYGAAPLLLAIDPRTGEELWQASAGEPGGQLSPNYAELMCVAGEYGLLSLWYGYDMFRFFAVRFGDGTLEELFTLYGQPSIILAQPGAMPAYRQCRVAGAVVELQVVDLQRGGGLLKFDLAGGSAQFTPQPIAGQLMVEDNSRPVGGGLADPADPPYPQALLPAAFEPPWIIPALTDGERFLVITASGASWHNW